MSTLDRLKELSQQATPGPCRVTTIQFDEETGDVQYVVEFPGHNEGTFPEANRLEVGINALPPLIEVAEAAWKALFVESKQMQDWTEEDIALYAALSQVMLDEKEGCE